MITKTSILYSLLGTLIILSGLFAYSFTGANWTSAPANPPNNNTEAPIDTSRVRQVKDGNFGANVLSANTAVWSDQYCNKRGRNCINHADLGGSDARPGSFLCFVKFETRRTGEGTVTERHILGGPAFENNSGQRRFVSFHGMDRNGPDANPPSGTTMLIDRNWKRSPFGSRYYYRVGYTDIQNFSSQRSLYNRIGRYNHYDVTVINLTPGTTYNNILTDEHRTYATNLKITVEACIG